MMDCKNNTLGKKDLYDSGTVVDTQTFKMPSCAFCYDRCGICRYYSTLNLSGYCDYHNRKVSSSDSACAQYS